MPDFHAPAFGTPYLCWPSIPRRLVLSDVISDHSHASAASFSTACPCSQIRLRRFDLDWLELQRIHPFAEVLDGNALPRASAPPPVAFSCWPITTPPPSPMHARSRCLGHLLTNIAHYCMIAGGLQVALCCAIAQCPSRLPPPQNTSDFPWSHLMDDNEAPFVRWFCGAEVNAAFNEVDRHVLSVSCRHQPSTFFRRVLHSSPRVLPRDPKALMLGREQRTPFRRVRHRFATTHCRRGTRRRLQSSPSSPIVVSSTSPASNSSNSPSAPPRRSSSWACSRTSVLLSTCQTSHRRLYGSRPQSDSAAHSLRSLAGRRATLSQQDWAICAQS